MSEQIDRARKRLSDSSPEVRRRALLELGTSPQGSAIALLLGALGDEDWRVRKEAANVLATLALEDDALDSLIDSMVQEENIGLRNAAAEVLASTGARATSAVVRRLQTLDPGGRKLAVEVLGASRDPRAVDVLVEALSDPDFNVRACAAEWLGELGGKKAVDALVTRLAGQDKLLVLAALQSLNQLGVTLSYAVLAPLVKHHIYGSELLVALGRSGTPQAAEHIARCIATDPAAPRALELLHSANLAAAAEVERVLSALPEVAVDELVRQSDDPEPAARQAAASCLLWSCNTDELPAIARLAQNESLYPLLVEGLRSWGPPAVAELEALTTESEGRDLASIINLLARLLRDDAGLAKADLFERFLNSSDLAVATAACGAVGRFSDTAVVPRLLALLDVGEERVHRAASHALSEIGRRHPIAVRRLLAGTELEGVRGISLCRVLQTIGTAEDAPALIAALGSPEPALRRAVIQALAAVAGLAAVETISFAMTDEDMGVRIAAATALAAVGPPAAETIISALRSATGPLKAALVRALGKVGHSEAGAILHALVRESSEVALAALEAMQALGIDATDVQRDVLAHPDAEVVKRALAVWEGKLLPADLKPLLEHTSWDVRLAAAERLAPFIDQKEIHAAIGLRLLSEPNDLVRIALARALGAEAQED